MESTTRPLIGTITKEDADEMVEAYVKAHPTLTKSVWFGLEQLDQLTTLLKAEKLTGARTDGVRVYFAQYTAKTLHDMPDEYLGKNTVVFVSTKEAETDGPIREKYHMDYFKGLLLEPSFPSVPENRGELCQPKCMGVTLPTP